MKKADAILISSPANIKYLTGYFNFSDSEREALILQIKNKKILITDKRYAEELNNKIKNTLILDTGARNFIFKDAENIFKKLKIKSIEIEEDNLTYKEYKGLKKFVKITQANTKSLREIKSKEEIKKIKKACLIGDKAYSFILNRIKLGISEKQIENELTNFFNKNHAEASFKSIIAFGKNSSIPHHESSDTKLKKNQIILMDFGVKIDGYCSDMTRTVFFGKADQKFKYIYNTVKNAQKKALNKIKVNINATDIDKEARNHIIENNFNNLIHAVGHGIGIEVHEPPTLAPKSKDKLRNGMVFSIEPGIYIPNYGGVRIEDLVYLESNKIQILTCSNKKLVELNIN